MEQSIVKTLSGTEALDSLLASVRQALARNGRFHPNMAYPGYRAEVTIRFFPAASMIPPVEQTLEILEGETEGDGIVLTQAAVVDQVVEIPVRPPNQVREEADLPTPVLTEDGEKWVKRKPGPPKNQTKGGETGKKSGVGYTSVPNDRQRPPHLGPEPAVTMVPSVVPVPKGSPFE